MGSHYAPPFSVIFMNYIESEALALLQSQGFCLQDKGILYKRYIDDSIIGPVDRDPVLFNSILNAFNSINDSIKFTLECPDGNHLNFLDLTISVHNNKKTIVNLSPRAWRLLKVAGFLVLLKLISFIKASIALFLDVAHPFQFTKKTSLLIPVPKLYLTMATPT